MSHLHNVANFMPLVAVVSDSSGDEKVRRRCQRTLIELVQKNSFTNIQSSSSPDEIRVSFEFMADMQYFCAPAMDVFLRLEGSQNHRQSV